MYFKSASEQSETYNPFSAERKIYLAKKTIIESIPYMETRLPYKETRLPYKETRLSHIKTGLFLYNKGNCP